MKDIKINKNIIKKKNASSFTVDKFAYISDAKKGNFFFSKVILSSCVFSISLYLFFVVSTIFYAVNTQKYVYKIENLNNSLSIIKSENNIESTEASVATEYINKNNNSKVSFINKTELVNISLK